MPVPAIVAAIPYIASAIPALKSLFGGDGGGNSAKDLLELLRQVPELRASLDLQTQNAQRQAPLHAATTQLAMNLLPKSAYGAYAGRPDVNDPSLYAPSGGAPAQGHQPGPNSLFTGAHAISRTLPSWLANRG